jgi:hypothetical protein
MELELNTDTLSLGQRLSRIFTSPSSVFMDLERNHSWPALLIISSISLVATLPLLSKMREFSIMQLQRMPDNPALSSPEAINLVGTTAVIGTIVGALLTPLLFALIIALLLKLYNAFAGDKVQYRKLFSVCVYAYLPLLLSSLIALVIGLTTPVESFSNDLLLKDTSGQYLHDLCKYHVGGQLKIAPEHISPAVTSLMTKSGIKEYLQFMTAFKQVNKKLKKEQYLIPYFISAHPGSTLNESVELAEFLRDHFQYYPEQVQNFTPTPMTISTSMYHTGINPLNNQEVYVPRETWERKAQRALLQYRNPKNKALVREALEKAKRTDLIGSSGIALIKDNNFISPASKTHRPKRKRK